MKRYILVFCDLRYATALRNIVCGNFIVILTQKIHIAIKRQSFFIIPPVNNKEENIVDLAVIFMTILGFTVRQKLITHLFLLISVRSHGERFSRREYSLWQTLPTLPFHPSRCKEFIMLIYNVYSVSILNF